MAGENRAEQGRREAAYPKVRGRLRTQACDGLQPDRHSTQLADGITQPPSSLPGVRLTRAERGRLVGRAFRALEVGTSLPRGPAAPSRAGADSTRRSPRPVPPS